MRRVSGGCEYQSAGLTGVPRARTQRIEIGWALRQRQQHITYFATLHPFGEGIEAHDRVVAEIAAESDHRLTAPDDERRGQQRVGRGGDEASHRRVAPRRKARSLGSSVCVRCLRDRMAPRPSSIPSQRGRLADGRVRLPGAKIGTERPRRRQHQQADDPDQRGQSPVAPRARRRRRAALPRESRSRSPSSPASAPER